MPSTYAHYRLGQEVYKSVSALARTAIKSHKELFDIRSSRTRYIILL